MNFPMPEFFTIYRPGSSTTNYVKGKTVVTTGTTETASLRGNFQRLTAKEKEMLPEGDRAREGYKIYTKTEVKSNDIIKRNSTSVKYEVRSVESWVDLNGKHSHYKVIVFLIEGN